MTIAEFDEKYAAKGGFRALNNFKDELMTLDFIAGHFEVDKLTVTDWFIKLYGMKYNPKATRRERIIDSMVRFAETHSLDDFREAYYYAGKRYYDEALAEAFSRGIYKEEKGNEVQLP